MPQSLAKNFSDTEIAALFKRGNFYSWAEVSRVHRVRMGIYQHKGHLISLLTDFGRINPCYPDWQNANGNKIFYTGNGRRGNQTLSMANRALLNAIKSKHGVPLFNKHAVGKWEFLGFWRVCAAEYIFDSCTERMIWRFLLVGN